MMKNPKSKPKHPKPTKKPPSKKPPPKKPPPKKPPPKKPSPPPNRPNPPDEYKTRGCKITGDALRYRRCPASNDKKCPALGQYPNEHPVKIQCKVKGEKVKDTTYVYGCLVTASCLVCIWHCQLTPCLFVCVFLVYGARIARAGTFHSQSSTSLVPVSQGQAQGQDQAHHFHPVPPFILQGRSKFWK